MKFGLDIAEAWLDSLSSVWKRVLFFWGFLVIASLIGQRVIGRDFDLELILRFGGVTYVFLGTLNYLTLVIAPIVWIRFIHLEEGGVNSFLMLGVAVALNAGFDKRHFISGGSAPWGLHVGVLIAGWVFLLLWVRRRKRGE